MLAGLYSTFGPANEVLKVVETDLPEPSKGQVRVKLMTSGVNPSDYKMRLGSRPLTHPFQIPGSDGAGFIDAHGEGVTKFQTGDRVWVFNAAYQRPFGTSAQYTLVDEWMVEPLPNQLNFEQGACLGIPVMTAYQCLFADGSLHGQTIYVVGGAGVVANYAIQLAKWGGAKVITSVSSQEKALAAQLAGADEVINYRTQDVVQEILRITQQQGVDRVIEVDFGKNLSTNTQILRPGGTCVMYAFTTQPELPLPMMGLMVKNITYKFTLVYSISPTERQKVLSGISQWLSESNPICNIAAKFDLDDIIKAHELVESGNKIGHVILMIPHPM